MAGAALIWLQQGAAPLFARLGRRIAGRWFEDAQERVEVLQAELSLIYGHAGRLAIGFFTHLLGWLGTGVAGWITYRALGVPIDFDDALAIEALLSAMAAIAFLVPVNAGVQEAGYAGLGAIFGVPPELSLGVSLVRRARDLAVGVPILLIWQGLRDAAVAHRARTAGRLARGGVSWRSRSAVDQARRFTTSKLLNTCVRRSAMLSAMMNAAMKHPATRP